MGEALPLIDEFLDFAGSVTQSAAYSNDWKKRGFPGGVIPDPVPGNIQPFCNLFGCKERVVGRRTSRSFDFLSTIVQPRACIDARTGWHEAKIRPRL
jgi:hypothetical protein